jgi:hypothetical protein
MKILRETFLRSLLNLIEREQKKKEEVEEEEEEEEKKNLRRFYRLVTTKTDDKRVILNPCIKCRTELICETKAETTQYEID